MAHTQFDTRSSELPGEFQQWLLEEFEDNGETVMFAPAAPMYATAGKGANEVRMAYVLECSKIERAMDILKRAIEVYNANSGRDR